MFASKVRLSSDRRLSDQVWRLVSGIRRLSSPFRCLSSCPQCYAQRCRRAAVCRLSSGFTLIEVLVAMTVLAIMVLMAANIFQSSSSAWNIGVQKAEMNTAARAALDFMARELQSAVAGEVETVSAGAITAIVFDMQNGNDVLFVALSGEPGGDKRALWCGEFYHDNNQLMYARRTESFKPYTELPSRGSSGVLITNVLSLQIRAFTNAYGLANGLDTEDFNSSDPANSNQLPLCVDIAIEMISDSDMQRYQALDVADQGSFCDRAAKVYSTRVYFPNRKGYGVR